MEDAEEGAEGNEELVGADEGEGNETQDDKDEEDEGAYGGEVGEEGECTTLFTLSPR